MASGLERGSWEPSSFRRSFDGGVAGMRQVGAKESPPGKTMSELEQKSLGNGTPIAKQTIKLASK